MLDSEEEEKKKSGTKSPPKTPASKAPLARHTGGGSGSCELRVVERVMRKESGTSTMLTRTNYMEWALVMQVKLQVARVWSAVTEDAADECDGWRALQIILTGVPPELMLVLAAKDSAKKAWETIKTLHMGSERAHEAKAQVRRREFEDPRFKDGESVEDFGLRLVGLVSDLELYGDPVTEHKAVQKFLRVVSWKYRQMAMAIESLVDLKTMTSGSSSGVSWHMKIITISTMRGSPAAACSSREEWLAHERRLGWGGSSSGGGGGKNKSPGKPKPHGGGGGRLASGSGGAGGSGGSGGKKKGKCHYCNKLGHWKKECCTRIKDEDEKGKQGQAHLVRDGDEHHEGLMMATVTMGVMTSIVAPQQVHLNEQKVYPESSPPGVWYFDIGATSHMKGERGMFTTLDESVQGSVKFGDGSHVAIRGRGSVIFRGQSANQRALSEVYFIPSLNSNIIYVGQLDEGGCKIEIHEGLMTIYDPGRRMMARVRRSRSRLYTAALTIDAPICLLTKSDDVTWRWHARMGHLHFRALRTMSSK
ncbi:uncharacterized protein [Aegilops tauschii subsp. strangulata]|uniref:uncharacterized protein n=1 Tax=Aegilops tauschii subsp. strangulata TaxID=200361 RepID=UPI00098B6B7D|nr:uncharacterized protein LOC109777468 [Aegilops tauschii subsp. strangulata]